MPVSVTMPRLGESVTEGTVTRWLKQEGDRVEVDEPLLEVSTDKVDTEIPSPAAGVLTRIVVSEDETAEVGSELAVINGGQDDAGQSDGGQTAPAENAAPASQEQPAEPEPAAAPAQPAADSAPPATGGDATAVRMPALGESVTEGTVTRWLKQVGDSVEVDEPLLEVSTDKVDTEIPSPVAGTLLEIKVPEDDTADVGAELALVGSPGGASAPTAPEPAAAPQAEPAQPQPAAQSEPAAPAPAQPGASYASPAPATESASPAQAAPPAQQTAPAAPPPSANGDGGYVTPLVRKLAAEQGVDLASVRGTGVGGRIRKQDVLTAAEQARAAAERAKAEQAKPSAPATAPTAAKAQPSPLRGRTEKMSRTRTVIAKRMHESLQSSAQLTTVVEVDVTKIARLRARVKGDFQAKHGVKLSFLPFFALAAVEALRTHPVVNASIDMQAGTITYPDGEHLGVAVDTERGLLVPVIRDAGDLNLGGLARRIADVAERTRTNKIGPDELSGATFTLTNTGSRGALFDTPIVPLPQAAILGTGAVVKRAAVVEDPELGEIIAPRSMVFLALSYDHRLVDGADAARFLSAVKERLEAGAFEGELGLS
ncbi:2-oxoglutarate dehydrogenase, E2 component, dihydrolipoamide succinyltransferase [Solwaraspora sp. WMMD937]|uniref:2-oxoglutarate dehydrogenase, E2 component, dihydrolipoamide succinyltransferase n=1 Tax=Solwaraspora sp. WMMD937 TaxID=3016090 RepID=UPI00249A3BDD|nr:2-oxoglutarate dehydrogenase, E2 component, dihydrolipoamide succinyltransferase [Solwaraspora sp. WMMD937]WFE21194.1 2-oxoglutarate dehydrogenase, E2 component, dihydrolipoamide succinyltransferase [Solwaraspora sp. WMMD937]